MGYSNQDLPISSIRNHKGATDYPDSIDSYLQKEIANGLIIGPFSSNPLSIPLSISPLNTVAKRGTEERWVIADFSFPEGFSVNNGISKETYLGKTIDLAYPTVDHLASVLQQFGPGCHIFKKDLKRAYREFHLDPKDINFSGYVWQDKIYLDLVLVMGDRSAVYLCQRVTDAPSYMEIKLVLSLLIT